MGNAQSASNQNDSNDINTSILRANKKIYAQINKQCQHSNKICSKHEDLQLLQTKLAILELQTVKGLKYSKTCGHPKCSNKAPHSLPDSDVFICSKHLQNIKQHFIQISKKANIKSHINKINEYGTNFEKQKIKLIHTSFIQAGDSFDGSININTEQPKYYWSLLMTKLLTALQFVKISQSNDTQVTEAKVDESNATQVRKTQIECIEGVMQLLIIYRFVMNPIGAAILAFIAAAV
eukprot:133124_1